jgi:hypothetical protein
MTAEWTGQCQIMTFEDHKCCVRLTWVCLSSAVTVNGAAWKMLNPFNSICVLSTEQRSWMYVAQCNIDDILGNNFLPFENRVVVVVVGGRTSLGQWSLTSRASIATTDSFCKRLDNSWKMKGNITYLKRVRRLRDSIFELMETVC